MMKTQMLLLAAAVGILSYAIALLISTFFNFASGSDAAGNALSAGLYMIIFIAFSVLASVIFFIIILKTGFNWKIFSLCAFALPCMLLLSGIGSALSRASFYKYLEDANAMHNPLKTKDPLQLEKLLQSGHNINEKNSLGQTALHYAAYNNDFNLIRFLVEHGADVNAADNKNFSPVHYLTTSNRKDSYGGTSFNYNPWPVFIYLAQRGATININDMYNGTPIIFAAAATGTPEVVKILLSQGADVNIVNSYGCTPLFNTTPEVARLLVAAGADIEFRNLEDEETPLFKYVYQDSDRYKQMLVFLLDNGANVNVRDKNGKTPLIGAIKSHSREITQILIARGADVNVKDAEGIEAIVLVAERMGGEEIKMFVSKGADVNAKNKAGETVYQIAQMRGVKNFK